MHEAKWTDAEGSTVTFKLPMDETAERQRNPFQKFTKRRKGRAGTRFAMVCYEIQDEAQGPMVYKDEAMLAGWNDSQSSGHTVKFWLCADGMGHPFEGYARKTEPFVLALIELDDDNEVIDQKMRDRVERSATRSSERLSYVAAMLCKSIDFQKYINDYTDQIKDFIQPTVLDEEGAKQWMYQKCGISSRAELDTESQSTVLFHAIRKEYLVWLADNTPEVPF
jgi:hypothetical protein